MSLRDLVTANACAPEHTGSSSTSGAGPSGSSAANPLAALANALHSGPQPGSLSKVDLQSENLHHDPVSLLHVSLPDQLTRPTMPPISQHVPLPQQPPIPMSHHSALADQFFPKHHHSNPSDATSIFERAFTEASSAAPSTRTQPQYPYQQNTYYPIASHHQSSYQPYTPSTTSSYAYHRANLAESFANLAVSQPPIQQQPQPQPQTQVQAQPPQHQEPSLNLSEDTTKQAKIINSLTTATDTHSWGDEFSSFETADPLPEFATTVDETTFELSGGIDAAYASWIARAEELRPVQHDGYQFSSQPTAINETSNPTRSAEQAFSEAIKLREAGRLPPAIAAFEEALNRPLNDTYPPLSDKNRAAAWYMLGITLAESDDDETAIHALQEGLKVYDGLSTGTRREDNPHLWNTLIALAVSYTNELDELKALRSISEWLQLWKAVRTGDAESGTTATMEDWRTDVGDSVAEQLKRELKRVSEEAPEDSDVFTVMGIFHNLNREYDLAVEAFRHAVMLRPTDSSLWNKLGATLANGGDSDEALRSYRKAVDLNPALIRAWVNVGTAYSNRGELQKAMRYYLKAISMANERDAQEDRNVVAKEGDHMHHVWSFLRVTVMSMSRPDLLELIENKDLNGLRRHFHF